MFSPVAALNARSERLLFDTIPRIGKPDTQSAVNERKHAVDTTAVTIGSGVTSIGSGVFYGCTSLANVQYRGSE